MSDLTVGKSEATYNPDTHNVTFYVSEDFTYSAPTIEVKMKKLSENAIVPTYAHDGDAGMDLYAAGTMLIPCGETRKVPTDIAMAIPANLVGLIYARSGLATKMGLRPSNCVGR